MTLKQVVEALVFASPKPLTTKEIITALKSAGNPEKTDDAAALEYAKTKEPEVEAALAAIVEEMTATNRAFRLMEQVNGWSFVTDPAAVHWVRQLYPEAKPTRLTGPQLETLAIIAYRQPVTRADIEAVRGVAVDSVVQVLMERSLIKIAGRAEVPGRPLLYSTTEYFLQHFGLKTVNELPNAAELRKIELPKAEVPAETPAGEKAEGEPKKKGGKKAAAAAAAAAASAEGAAENAAPVAAPAEGAEGAVSASEDAASTAAPAEADSSAGESAPAESESESEVAAEPEPAFEPEPEPEFEPEPEPEPVSFAEEPAPAPEPVFEPEPAPEPAESPAQESTEPPSESV